MAGPPDFRWRLLRVLAGLGAVLAFVGVILVQLASKRAWERTLAWADAEQRRWEQQDFRRPVCWGDATPGSSFAAYQDATALIQRHPELAERVNRELRRLDADRDERHAALATLAPALRALRRGAHAENARDPFDWSKGFSNAIPNLLAYRCLANTAVARAHQLMEAGDDLEAVRVLLDGAQCGRDLMQSPILVTQMVGCALVAISTQETVDRKFLDRLSTAALKELNRGLQVLDDGLPVELPARLAETVILVRIWESSDVDDSTADSALEWSGGLRYGFSDRLLVASAVELLVAHHERCAETATLPWPEARQLQEESAQKVTESGNPHAACAAGVVSGADLSRRTTLAQLRLLRADVAYRSGLLLSLDDPIMARPLLVREQADGVHFVSAVQRDNRPLERVAPLVALSTGVR